MSATFDLIAELRSEAQSSSLARLRDQEVVPCVVSTGISGEAEANLLAAMARRRSTRFFSERPIPRSVVDDMLAAARHIDATLWPALAHHDPLRLYVAARAVSGIPKALYVEDEMLRYTADLDEQAVQDMVLQPEFAQAPMLLLVVGSLETALDAHGHRVMLERSGAACEAACLTAVAQGYAGSIFAGFLPTALKRLTGIDGFRRTQLLALAVGTGAGASSVDAVTSASR